VDGDDLVAIGADPAEVEKLRILFGTRAEVEVVRVLPGNWLALRVFMAQDGRWRRTPHGGIDGLDLCQIESALRLLRDDPVLLEKLMTMEAVVLEELNR
jgi:hypothetical protein